jgi:hypothetical protein
MKKISIATWLNSRRTYTRCLPPTSMACCRKGYIHLLHYGTRSQGHKAPGRPKQRSHHLGGHSRPAAKALHSRQTSVGVPTTIATWNHVCTWQNEGRWNGAIIRQSGGVEDHVRMLTQYLYHFEVHASLTIMSRAWFLELRFVIVN